MNPVLAEVYRKNVVESCHRGSVVVVNHHGETVFSLGDVERNIYPRSSMKMFQAIPLVESGAADSFQLSESEISLACASHNAESTHVEAVESWLSRIGLGIDDLENGPDMPLNEQAKHALLRNKVAPTRAHQNCSGKHTGMLTLARHMNVATQGYSDYQHPTQQAWIQTLSELVEIDISRMEWERDGCGMPAVCMPMERLAYGCALFANPEKITSSRQDAMRKIIKSIQQHPYMIAGTDRCCSEVIERTKGKVVVKTGAEAVYAGIIPSLGLGLVLKIDDGNSRGSEVALGAVLSKLGVLDQIAQEKLGKYFQPEIYNSQNWLTGRIMPSKVWD